MGSAVVTVQSKTIGAGSSTLEVSTDAWASPRSAIVQLKELSAWLEELARVWWQLWAYPNLQLGQVRELLQKAVPMKLLEDVAEGCRQMWSPRTICIHTDHPVLTRIPWELLPNSLNVPDAVVVRSAGAKEARDRSDWRHPRILLVTPAGQRYEQERREAEGLCEFCRRHDGVRAALLPAPTLSALQETAGRLKPTIVHLTSGGQWSWEKGHLEIPLRDEDGRPALVSHRQLAGALGDLPSLRLLVLNVCDSGAVAAAEMMADLKGVQIYGWGGLVGIDHSNGFARAFYDKLLSGAAPVEAISRVKAALRRQGSVLAGVAPAYWVPSVEVLKQELGYDAASVEDACEDGLEGLVESPPLGAANASEEEGWPAQKAAARGDEIILGLVDVLCPALLQNGLSPIASLGVVTSRPHPSLLLTLECDTGAGRSTWRKTVSVESFRYDFPRDLMPKFPILYELIARGSDRREISFTASASADGGCLAETTESVLFLGPMDWLDRASAWPYTASYVLSECEGVQRIITKAQGILEVLAQDRDAAFTSYKQHVASLEQQVRAIYQALQHGYDLHYITAPGLKPNPGAEPMGQRVRFPDEVLRHRRGTCHDLALLFASCLEHVGIYPLLVIASNHTFCGYWTNTAAYDRFWHRHRPKAGLSGIGGTDTWVMPFDDLLQLIPDEAAHEETADYAAVSADIRLVESTWVAHKDPKDVSFGAALRHAEGANMDLDIRAIIDVRASRAHVQPIYRLLSLDESKEEIR